MARRLLHYAILAAVLLGVPALCAWWGADVRIWDGVRSFPPRTEFLLHDWKRECPFSWWWWGGYAAFVVLCTFAFVRRALRAAWGGRRAAVAARVPAVGVFPWWGWLGVGIIAVFWTL